MRNNWFRKAFKRPPESTLLYREGGGTYASGSNERIYRDCPAVNKAVDLLATGIAQMDYDCDVDFEALIVSQSKYEFIFELVEQMLVFGYGVIRVNRDPVSLMPTRLYVMSQGVEVEFENQLVRVKDGDRQLRPSEYIFVPDTTSVWGYESRVCRIAPVANALIAAHRYVNREFSQPQSNIFALSSPVHTQPNSQENTMKSLKNAVNEQGGRGVFFLDNGEKIERFTTNDPANPDIRHLVDQLVRQVAAFFGLPANLLGSDADSKYNNVTARTVGMHRESFAPLADRISARLSLGLDCMFKLNVESLLRGDIESQVRLAVEASGGPVMTANEARQHFLGFDPVSKRELNGSMQVDTRDQRGEYPSDSNIVNMPSMRHQDT